MGIYYAGAFMTKNPLAVLRSLNVFRYGKRAASLTLLYQIVPFLKKGPYDIVHCHFGPSGNFGVILKELKVLGGKFITTFHGYDMSKYLKNNGKYVYNSLFKKGDLFLPISECWKAKLIELGCHQDKIIVHRMGVDTTKFSLTSPKPKIKKIQILTIARLVEKKGVEYSVKAIAELISKFPDVEYNIVGDGPLKESLEILIAELNVSDSIKLLGWKQQEEIGALLAAADILLAPSVTSHDGDQEGIPVVLMEALAQGVPVVSTYHSGIPELVQDQKTGLLAQEGNVNSLVEKLEYLLMNREVLAKMRIAGRTHVEECYEIQKLNDQLVILYRKLMNGDFAEAC